MARGRAAARAEAGDQPEPTPPDQARSIQCAIRCPFRRRRIPSIQRSPGRRRYRPGRLGRGPEPVRAVEDGRARQHGETGGPRAAARAAGQVDARALSDAMRLAKVRALGKMPRCSMHRARPPVPARRHARDGGANVAVFSAHAERIELCLFDAAGAARDRARWPCPSAPTTCSTASFPGLRAGQVYGLRAHGALGAGARPPVQPAQLLLDPYAGPLTGRFRWAGPNLVDRRRRSRSTRATARRSCPRPWSWPPAPAAGDAGRPGTPWDRTVLYEAHVKGLTQAAPGRARGAARAPIAGLAQPAVLEHLVRLGITAVELLPVAAFLDELRLVRLGLRNYWGYNPYAFMVPEPRYGGADPAAEFRAMVAALHGAGIEVILDVVLQPHRRDRPSRARPSPSAASTMPATTGSIPTTRAATSTGPAPATRSTSATRACCSSSMDALAPLGGAGRRRLPLRSRHRRSAATGTAASRRSAASCRRSRRTRCWAG